MSTVGGTGLAPVGAGASGTAAAAAGGGQKLGQNAFLQLLVAQLKYQNPMQPVSNTQFVTQLAQFQMLSVLQQIKTDLDKMAAAVPSASTSTSTSASTSTKPGASTAAAPTGGG